MVEYNFLKGFHIDPKSCFSSRKKIVPGVKRFAEKYDTSFIGNYLRLVHRIAKRTTDPVEVFFEKIYEKIKYFAGTFLADTFIGLVMILVIIPSLLVSLFFVKKILQETIFFKKAFRKLELRERRREKGLDKKLSTKKNVIGIKNGK